LRAGHIGQYSLFINVYVFASVIKKKPNVWNQCMTAVCGWLGGIMHYALCLCSSCH